MGRPLDYCSAIRSLVDPTCHTNEAFHFLVGQGGVAAPNCPVAIQAQQVNACQASSIKDNTRYPGMEGKSQIGNLKLEYNGFARTYSSDTIQIDLKIYNVRYCWL